MSSYTNPLPPTVQWDQQTGYCGEVSLITAGLYYGQYIPQAKARELAGNLDPLLLGENDNVAAAGMKLAFTQQKSSDSGQFLQWVKTQVIAGFPVAIGVFENRGIFGEGSDSQYDHIVVVTGVDSDKIYFTDEGLYTDDDDQPIFYFNYPFSQFQKTRQAADVGPDVYSLCLTPAGPKIFNYGISITGVQDDTQSTIGPSTIRLQMTTTSNTPGSLPNEGTWETGKNPPAPISLTLTTTAPNIPSGTYNLYRYTDPSQVPTKNFNAQGITPVCQFTNTTWKDITETIQSNECVLYRAVLSTVP